MKVAANKFGGFIRDGQQIFAVSETGVLVIAQDNDGVAPWRDLSGEDVRTNPTAVEEVCIASVTPPEHYSVLTVVNLIWDGEQRTGMIVTIDETDEALPYRVIMLDGIHSLDGFDYHWVQHARIYETVVRGVDLSRFIEPKS